MNKLQQINNVRDLSVGQLYMFLKYSNELRAGKVTAIKENGRVTLREDYGYESVIILNDYSHDKLYLYDGNLLKRFNRLKERHKQEIQDFLDGKEVQSGFRNWVDRIKRKRW